MASLHLLVCCATTLLIANALELTPQLLGSVANEPSSGKAKMQYTPFPLLDDEVDVEAVELPLDVDQDQDNLEQLSLPTRTHHSQPPAWLQFADEPVQKPRFNNKASFIKLPAAAGQQHKHPHGHAHGHGSGSGNGPGSCTIEITSKVPGICQPMNMGVGSACISGEFMEVYSASHCSNY